LHGEVAPDFENRGADKRLADRGYALWAALARRQQYQRGRCANSDYETGWHTLYEFTNRA
jgi:hypothetical protein